MKIMIPCDEANHVCDKSQYKEAKLGEKLKLMIHLLYCKACRKYSKNNEKLTQKIKESKIECLDTKSKESMKVELQNAINKELD